MTKFAVGADEVRQKVTRLEVLDDLVSDTVQDSIFDLSAG